MQQNIGLEDTTYVVRVVFRLVVSYVFDKQKRMQGKKSIIG